MHSAQKQLNSVRLTALNIKKAAIAKGDVFRIRRK